VADFHAAAPEHMQETTAWARIEMGEAAQRTCMEQMGVDPEPLEQTGKAVQWGSWRRSARYVKMRHIWTIGYILWTY